MGGRPPLRIALEVWGHDYGRLVDTARVAERLGFDAVYLGESPHGLNLETWTALGGVAEATASIRLGPVIAHLLPAYRSFPLLVRQLHTLAVVSGGRGDFRTGTGAAGRWARPWWEPAGLDYPARAARRAILEEWLRAFHHVWSRPGEPFYGECLRFERLPLEPTVERPPLTVAASGPQAMELAARYADVWETSYLTPAELRREAARFQEAAARYGRPVARGVEVDAVTAATGAERRRLKQRFLAERGPSGPAALARALTGPPAAVAEQMADYADAGADRLLVAAVDPHDRASLEALAEAAALQPPR